MPIFYFDLYDGERAIRDEYGIDLGTVEEAADQAAALLPELARDALPGEASCNLAAFVRDEGGSLVHRAALLFRAQTLGEGEVARTSRLAEADDLIMRSRETRQMARHISAKIVVNVADLLTIIEQAAKTVEDARAIAACRAPGPIS